MTTMIRSLAWFAPSETNATDAYPAHAVRLRLTSSARPELSTRLFRLTLLSPQESSAPRVRRHRTAIGRTGISAPIALGLEHGLIAPGVTLFDYGCGRGGDLTRLRAIGIEAAGWDPAHAPHAPREAAAVVNLGFVLNVIEDPRERVHVLNEAWALAREALIVAVRPDWEARQVSGRPYGDGLLTGRGTFQKFFEQEEARQLIEATTATPAVAVAPGVFFCFRDPTRANDFRARSTRARLSLPRISAIEAAFERHRAQLEPLIQFVEERGRLPLDTELPNADELRSSFGSLKRAYSLVRRVEGDERWAAARKAAEDNLIVFLALSAFRGRPNRSELSEGVQADIHSLFGSYRAACDRADQALFGLRDHSSLDQHLRASRIGKVLPDALYVHINALPHLALVLRLYEGCARALIGEVKNVSLVKLSREHRSISYLSYPTFDKVAHPPLAASLRVDLRHARIRHTDFSQSANPPILHRKETMVPPGYPGLAKFVRLTHQEESYGLFNSGRAIGTRNEWEDLLRERGLRISGHRVFAVQPT